MAGGGTHERKLFGALRTQQALKPLAFMDWSNPDVRLAYKRGAHEAFDALYTLMKPGDARYVMLWLFDLDDWSSGPPPIAPYETPHTH